MDSRLTSGAASPVSLFSNNSSAITTPEPDSDNEGYATLAPSTNANRKYILVLGGLGFIGSHTSLELLKAGYSVIIVDDLSNSFHDVLSRVRTAAETWCKANRKPMGEIQFHKVDYRSKAMHFLLESYSDLVTSVSDSIASPMAYYRNNVCGLVDLLELLGKHNIFNFVFSSSATRATRELGWVATESIAQCARDLWNFVSKTRAVQA
ncbi:hypothetical protein VdG1_04355 [Verticillium dahliae VDG1]|nr:hypothetical protein VdG1_04355 [Verticillium dahliae VDG1]